MTKAPKVLVDGEQSQLPGSKPRLRVLKTEAPAKQVRESSHDRLFAIIDLFTLERPVWTAEEIGAALSLSRTTLYRYLRTLGTAGFVAPLGSGRFVLGPRVIELDRQIRLSDPLLKVAVPVMQKAIGKFDGLLLLCTYYRDKVMTIHHESSDPGYRFSMQRGQPFPLFRGSPSKSILAHLPPYQLKTLMLHEARAIREAGLGETWPEFRDKLRAIRNAGVCVALGEIDPELFGMSAPIFRGPGDIAGSLTVVIAKKKFKEAHLPRYIEMAKKGAAEISAGVTQP
ncbi:MAG: IclR family transcriptional regulator [Burkholderiaceae bacterium]